MSHEIRTPMNGIMVMADLLANADIPRRLHRYAEVIATSGRSLLSIINDILDFSKIEAGKLELEKGEFASTRPSRTSPACSPSARAAKNIDLAAMVDPDCPARSGRRRARLSQVIGNLVNNALKFTETGFVNLTVSIGPASSRLIDLTVEDTGIGIPEISFQRSSKSFPKLTKRRPEVRRHRVGLAICRRIVTAMGGNIEVTSSRRRRFEIPCPDPTGDVDQPILARSFRRQLSERSVCIIDVAGEATVPRYRIILAPSVIR